MQMRRPVPLKAGSVAPAARECQPRLTVRKTRGSLPERSVQGLHLDHVVYAVPDLDLAVDDLEQRLGVRATPGGKHQGLGTHNALLALASDAYLEVIGPDPEQPQPARSRPFGIDELGSGRVVTWAAKAPDLEDRVAAARAGGYDPGTIMPLSRSTPDGERIEWRLTLAPEPAGDGLVPFLIDWGATVSPARSAAKGCTIVELRAEHPDPATVSRCLTAIGEPLPVERGPRPQLIAVLDTPKGRVELR